MFAGLVAVVMMSGQQWEWEPADGPLKTRWAKDVHADKVLPEYPRPQMVRKDWVNLNGVWGYAVTSKSVTQTPKMVGPILVPFAIESSLSGVARRVSEDEVLWYRRSVNVKKPKGRMLLHFGAVDYQCQVWMNGREVGSHTGGYDPFSFDVTEAMQDGENEVVLRVTDATGDYQPRGKQWRKPQGIWYTATTGIWQTVWMEPVPESYIRDYRVTPDLRFGTARVTVDVSGGVAEVTVLDGKRAIGTATSTDGSEVSIPIKNPKLWSPEKPFLYRLRIRAKEGKRTLDEVEGYFAMRSAGLAKDDSGVLRLALNGKPTFMLGPLDQGFWPDGIYTAPTDEALKYDIEMTKKLGFNTIRKHVKVEPARWYYWCDKLGMMVWQDMPSPHFEGDAKPTSEQLRQFDVELERMIETHYNVPSIVMWVPFNEGWGQHETPRVVDLVRRLDHSRLINNASGWTDEKVGDTMDIHNYPAPAAPPNEPTRAAVLGEFGGLGLPIDGHTWSKQNWGYQGMSDRDALTDKYVRFLRQLYALKDKGLSAGIYTQTTDVETETNGLMTYDREILKVDEGRVRRANLGDFRGLRDPAVVIPTSQEKPLEWAYTFEAPRLNWMEKDFDDSSWKRGNAGFGTRETPAAAVGTLWNTSDIWIRREFLLPKRFYKHPQLRMHHDDDVEVYINGVLAFKGGRWTSDYDDFPMSPEAVRALIPGKNVIAIHCHQNSGGQYIDAGIVD